MYVEKSMEMRAIKREIIINYFVKLNGKEIENGKIIGHGWEVKVSKESLVSLGSFSMPSVNVVIRCKKELFKKIYDNFCLQFFHAGG